MVHRVAPQAEAELDNIWYYVVKEIGSIEIADRLIDSITERFFLLACHPHIGRRRDEDLRPGLRSFPVGEYVNIYRVEEKDVLILHVFRGQSGHRSPIAAVTTTVTNLMNTKDLSQRMNSGNPFFDHPILNSPYGYPERNWELDDQGQPTQKVIEHRRLAEFITPIPKPKKRKGKQTSLVFDEGLGLSTASQQYNHTAIINSVRNQVDKWRRVPDPTDWHVTPETVVFGRLSSKHRIS
jgi:plasmid stabilization system protein ParE